MPAYHRGEKIIGRPNEVGVFAEVVGKDFVPFPIRFVSVISQQAIIDGSENNVEFDVECRVSISVGERSALTGRRHCGFYRPIAACVAPVERVVRRYQW